MPPFQPTSRRVSMQASPPGSPSRRTSTPALPPGSASRRSSVTAETAAPPLEQPGSPEGLARRRTATNLSANLTTETLISTLTHNERLCELHEKHLNLRGQLTLPPESIPDPMFLEAYASAGPSFPRYIADIDDWDEMGSGQEQAPAEQAPAAEPGPEPPPEALRTPRGFGAHRGWPPQSEEERLAAEDEMPVLGPAVRLAQAVVATGPESLPTRAQRANRALRSLNREPANSETQGDFSARLAELKYHERGPLTNPEELRHAESVLATVLAKQKRQADAQAAREAHRREMEAALALPRSTI